MNFLDRAIAAFSPERGLSRAVARAHIAAVRGAYDGATLGRRATNWRASNASPNLTTRTSLHTLRARSRDVVRNTWWGPRIISNITAHAVGTGYTPVCKESAQAVALWKEWGRGCDAEGQLTFDGLCGLACRSIVESGEVLARLIPIAAGPGKVPLEIQLLEPDHLDGSRDSIVPTRRAGSADPTIVDQGIEYGPDGKRRAFWLFPEHPGARGLIGITPSVRVAAADVLHIYRKERIGQGRGVPWIAPVLLKGRDLSEIEEAVQLKAKIEACFAAFRKLADPSSNLAQATRTERRQDGSTRRVESISPGTITDLYPGEEIAAVQPSSGMAFESVLINTWMTLAAGAGLTYDQMTGDLRQANYSSLRAGKIEFRRLIEQFQYLTLLPMLLDQVWARFIAASVDAGLLPYRRHGYAVEWITPAWEPIDPLKDLQADILAVRSGRLTWAQFVAGWGYEPNAQLDEIETWQKDLDARGIVLDSDPRRSIKNIKGAQQNDSSGGVLDPAQSEGNNNDASGQ